MKFSFPNSLLESALRTARDQYVADLLVLRQRGGDARTIAQFERQASLCDKLATELEPFGGNVVIDTEPGGPSPVVAIDSVFTDILTARPSVSMGCMVQKPTCSLCNGTVVPCAHVTGPTLEQLANADAKPLHFLYLSFDSDPDPTKS